jgi:hypothetical protein
METVIEKCPTEEQCSVVRFLCAEGLAAKDIHKEMFSVFTVGSVCHVKRFTIGLQTFR